MAATLTLMNNQAVVNAPPPKRAGLMWVDQDFLAILEAVRAGITELEEIAERIERPVSSTTRMVRRMLPPSERGVPIGVSGAWLRRLAADRDFDWRKNLAEPMPVRTYACTEQANLQGLDDETFLHLAYTAMLYRHAVPPVLVTRLVREIIRRELGDDFVLLRQKRLMAHPGSETPFDLALAEADGWWAAIQKDSTASEGLAGVVTDHEHIFPPCFCLEQSRSDVAYADLLEELWEIRAELGGASYTEPFDTYSAAGVPFPDPTSRPTSPRNGLRLVSDISEREALEAAKRRHPSGRSQNRTAHADAERPGAHSPPAGEGQLTPFGFVRSQQSEISGDEPA